jgi:uncharacterized protein (TIGR02246 family)
MLSTKEVNQLVKQRFDAWAQGDPVRVLDLYHEDARYWDTRHPQGLKGKAALAAHLKQVLGSFDMKFALLEEHRLTDRDAAIALWECAVRPRGEDGKAGQALMLQRGMNILEIRDGLIVRDECYNDAAALGQLLSPQT